MGHIVKTHGAHSVAPSAGAPWEGNMPPVADRELMEVVDALIDRGENGITNVSELARRMYGIDQRRNAESWRKDLRRWRRTANPREADIAIVARAFNVKRELFPPAKVSPTVAEIDRRLAARTESGSARKSFDL